MTFIAPWNVKLVLIIMFAPMKKKIKHFYKILTSFLLNLLGHSYIGGLTDARSRLSLNIGLFHHEINSHFRNKLS